MSIEEQIMQGRQLKEYFLKHAHKLIRRAYYSGTGLSTANKIYLDVHPLDKRVTLSIIRDWFKENVPKIRQVSGPKNSYVAQHPYQEYQVDIFYITEKQLPGQKYPFGLSMIDIFTKYATVIPLVERKAPDVMAAIMKGFKEMGHQPDVIYSDEEGALMEKTVSPEFEKMGIQFIVTSSSAHFVERFNRTFKWLIHKRIQEFKRGKRMLTKTTPKDKSKVQWTDFLHQALAVYNNKDKHRIIGMTPSEARKPSNQADVKVMMEMSAIRGRKYPIIQVGDTVKILRKHKQVGDKEWMDQFKAGEHKVVSISKNFDQTYYKLTDGREYLRSDIVNI